MKQETINNAIDRLTHLDGLLNERIEDMMGGKPKMQAIHAYTLYGNYIDMAAKAINEANYKEACSVMHALARCFDHRVLDLHNVKGVQHYRHAFILYRRLVRDAWYPIRDELNKKKK